MGREYIKEIVMADIELQSFVPESVTGVWKSGRGVCSVPGLSSDEFKFDSQGDGPARYNIIHFKQVSRGKYSWVTVGQYVEGELRLNMSEVHFKLDDPKPPSSVCSLPCLKGQAMKYVEGESCCWHCFNCSTYQIVNPDDETQCVTCDWGTLPSPEHLRCNPIPEVYIQPDSWWAIGAMLFSSVGLVMTGVVMWVFVSHNDTPVVRASGRELSYVLLSGVFLCYAMTFVFVLKPSAVVCGIQRFGLGFCFAVVYSALLTKTNRIARIFNAGKRTAKRPSFITPKSQLCICFFIVSIQVVITGLWWVVSPPRAIHHYIVREDNFLVCAASINASYMIAFAFPIGLIIVCTVYAVLTRKIPEAFNESKHIGFTMYTTCIIWLAFVPIYFSTASNVEVRITTTSVTISLSATVALVCLFTPKLYILLLHPERNVRQSMMPAAKYSAIKTTLSASSQRVDSGTQSEVIFPVDYELHEKLRTMGCSTGPKSNSATQTCPSASCSLPDHRCGATVTLTASLHPSATNGPMQDVPDVQL
ncbi:metabotropic glutamate receptor-like [Penaeus japonicus]|uniref:metabotropic glutamate receptor-like n=1 Tax=Penaeus japonicus TaxID=27405 RepID=UPI001C70D702|nr:metabotropic glutamate receptor-like [Penaeus japonicus]